MSDRLETHKLRVQAVRLEADSIVSIELRDPRGADLPAFSAGAHVDLRLPNGLVRSYSLCGDPRRSDRYTVAVNRDTASRGGSSWIHENLRVGQMIPVTPPRNNFELHEDAEHSVFIAGGVGITPLLAMIRRLTVLGKPWTLWFATRTQSQMAFTEEIEALAGDLGTVHLHYDEESRTFLDLDAIVAQAPAGSHFYCCGPLPMLKAFEAVDMPRELRHIEYFQNDAAPDTEGGFEVELTESGVTLQIPEGKSILDTMMDAGIDVPYSCTEGICGTCETRVLSGEPDHRDLVLTDSEKESGEVMMICVSGSKSDRLVLER